MAASISRVLGKTSEFRAHGVDGARKDCFLSWLSTEVREDERAVEND
jgi:hypothetical protein